MQAELKEEGTFRVEVLEWAWVKHESGAQSVKMKLGIVQKWHDSPDDPNGGQWSQLWPNGYTVYLQSNMIKKDESMNEGAARALMDCGVWDGDVERFTGDPPEGFIFIVDVAPEEYNGKTYWRADWAKPNSDVPPKRGGGLKPTDPSLVKQVNARFGSQFRALKGGGAPPAQPQGQARVAAPAPPAVGGPASPPAPPVGPDDQVPWDNDDGVTL